MREPKLHLHNPDDKTGWISICGIHTSSIVDDVEEMDEEEGGCKRCLKILEGLPDEG